MSLFNFFKSLYVKYLFKDTSNKNIFDHYFFDLKYYLHQDASIENFAFLLNITSNKVARITSTYYHCSFQVLLNEHRCNQVLLELNNPVNAGLSMESIVKLSGFKSSEQYSDYLKGNMNKIKSGIKILSIVLVMMVSLNKVQSQVSIGVPVPSGSAMLDVSSTTKGFLPPRMSEIQRVLILKPDAGLMVYQTDGRKGIYYYDGTSWTYVMNQWNTMTPNETVVVGGAGASDNISTLGSVVYTPNFTTTEWSNVGGFAGRLRTPRKIFGNSNLFDGTADLTMNLVSDGISSFGGSGRGFLTVSGNTTLNGVTKINNNATITGTLTVEGASTLKGTLGVSGATTLNSTLAVNSATTLSSTLTTAGLTTLNAGLQNNGNITNTGTFTTTGLAITNGGITNNGTLTNNGNATITGTLGVTGATTLNSTLAVNSATTLSSTLTTAGLTTLNGGLTNNGRLTNIGNATITGTLSVSTVSPTSTPAVLELSSTTQGFLPPRLTTTQRDAITAPVEGLTIWNTLNKQLEVYDGSYWVNMNGKLVSTLTVTLTVGQRYGGGKVAYIFTANDPGYIAGQTHGLIAAEFDQTISSTVKWLPNSFYGATGTILGQGLPNTISLIAAAESLGTSNLSNYAAGLAYSCRDGGYSDWYLPSKDELAKLYLNKALIGGFATTGDAAYWSSSQKGYMNFSSFTVFKDGVSTAWVQLFFASGSDPAGTQKDLGITNARRVRAVRVF